MYIHFQIDYHTVYGEVLYICVLPCEDGGTPSKHAMYTSDGRQWICDVEMQKDDKRAVDYYYEVVKDGTLLRHEWLVVPHRLDLSVYDCAICYVSDHWIDTPDDAFMYSSAFTECLHPQTASCNISQQKYSRTLILKVRTTQLASGEQLALLGDTPYLGQWNEDKALPMVQHSPCEWMICIDDSELERRRIEFKFVSIDKQGSLTKWETGDNRYIILPDITDDELLSFELPQAKFLTSSWRGAGTVIPVFSLRSEGSFGVGDFGDLRMMVDWCAITGQSILQILPINDSTIDYTWSDSYPYNSISIFALHPQYADFRQLPLLKESSRRKHYEAIRKRLNSLPQIDYEQMIHGKMDYLHEVFSQEGKEMVKSAEFNEFFRQNAEWLIPYAAFSHYRDTYGTADFSQWPDHHKLTDDERDKMGKTTTKQFKEVAFWYFVQFVLDKQMRSVHDYARQHHVILKGDIPIGICRYGVEAWSSPHYFNMNGQAGAPPDAFSVNGQNWGFPTYEWNVMLKDGCSWWIKRFRKMAEYFDAYRIDHVLGFFRIWEIPLDAVHGLLGQFSPSLGMTREEIEAFGLSFDENLYLQPYITDNTLQALFADETPDVRKQFLRKLKGGRYQMKQAFNTQRKVEVWWKKENAKTDDPAKKEQLALLRNRLYSLISNVLFLRDHRKQALFHPRISAQMDSAFLSLNETERQAFNQLYEHYFYHRNNQFWYDEAMKKLPCLTEATRMLVCAEDLGMIPQCVPWVMDRLNILSLEIQSMPKEYGVRFGRLEHNPYRSVCTIFTHDMPTLRQWWDEDEDRTRDYYNNVLHHQDEPSHPLSGLLAEEVVRQHLQCPSILCLISLQDWLATDESLRAADPNSERINIPVNPRHYWRYRMHLTIEQLLASVILNENIHAMITAAGRS